jgi:flagellar basal-body rod protein FlgB
MRTSLDSYLGIHPQALALEAQRTQQLAANLANVDTPNYKARDIDFKAALAAAGGDSVAANSSTLPLTPANAARQPDAGTATSPGAASDAEPVGGSGSAANAGALKYRVPLGPSLDGNTVDEQLEQSAFAENNVRYQATLTFLNAKLRNLMTAITGQ